MLGWINANGKPISRSPKNNLHFIKWFFFEIRFQFQTSISDFSKVLSVTSQRLKEDFQHV